MPLDFVAPLRLAPEVLYRLELVLEGTLMNRLWHAWPEGGEHHTALAVEVLPDALRLMFEDDGRAFNPLQAADPARPTSLSEAAPGGLGLLLTRRAVCEAGCERVPGRNRLWLEIARPGPRDVGP